MCIRDRIRRGKLVGETNTSMFSMRIKLLTDVSRISITNNKRKCVFGFLYRVRYNLH